MLHFVRLNGCLSRQWFAIGAIVLALLAACGTDAPTGPAIRAEDVWSRPAVAMGEMSGESSGGEMGHGVGGTGAVFMTLLNEGSEPDRLIGAQTDVADVVEIHETRMEGDVMKMQLLPEGLEVPAKGEVELKPGGYHIMLIGVKHDLEVGDDITLVLDFATSDPLTVQAQVREP